MKIALIAPIEESVPPRKYGGIEWIVYELAHGMGLRGHQVDLYASEDSKNEKSYNLIPLTPFSLRSDEKFSKNPKMLGAAKIQSAIKAYEMIQKGDYDIVHNHAGWRFLLFSNLLGDKMLTTLHGRLSVDFEKMIFDSNKNSQYISISNNQRRDAPELNYISTIYNGIDIDKYPFEEDFKDKEHMVFFARMDSEKGAKEAAKVAHRTKKKLIVAAKVDATDEAYFSEFRPLVDGHYVRFVGEVDHETKIRYYQGSRCLLAPIKWEEPFGLFFTESMATGTPVVTFARGSAPEIIKDGETGFLVNHSDDDKRGDFIIKKTGIEGLCEAVDRIYSMPADEYRQMRKNARKHVEENFGLGQMIDGYEDAYRKILANSKP